MSLSPYNQKILEAFNAVSEANGGQGASAAEVTKYMADAGTISPRDTVIDIADLMDNLSKMGYIGERPSRI